MGASGRQACHRNFVTTRLADSALATKTSITRMIHMAASIGLVATALSTTMLVACGGGGSSNSGGGSNSSATNATTALIKSNLVAIYKSESESVDGAVKNCFKQNGISGASLNCATNVKAALVLSFTNSALSSINSIWATDTIDKAAVLALLDQYNSSDLLWLNTETFAPTMIMTADEVSTLSGAYSSKVNLYYSNLILRVNSLTLAIPRT